MDLGLYFSVHLSELGSQKHPASPSPEGQGDQSAPVHSDQKRGEKLRWMIPSEKLDGLRYPSESSLSRC